MNGKDTLKNGHLVYGGFLTAAEIRIIAEDPDTRLTQLLVRCGGVRFIAGAQDVPKLIEFIEAGGDYVRDVSVRFTQ